MVKLLTIIIVVINISSATLYDTTLVVRDEAIELGAIKSGESCSIKIPRDSVRVIFTLEQGREDWLGTDVVLCDTIRISDETEIFELDVEKF